MTTLNVDLPDELAAFLADQSARGGFGSADDYLRSLIQAEQTRQARRQLEGKLHDALSSGPARPFTAADWANLRQEALDGLAEETGRP